MRTLTSEVSGVHGSELLSVLMCRNASRPELDESVAQVVTMRVGSGDVTALVLAPKTAFEVELDPASELAVETVVAEGEDYDWFEHWDRMVVLRSKEGPPSDKRAEAVLLGALRRRLERSVAQDNQMATDAVDALCAEVFDGVDELYRILEEEGEGEGEMQRLDGDGDDVSVALTRPVEPSELKELLTQVPVDFRPALRRAVVWKTEGWKDVEVARSWLGQAPWWFVPVVILSPILVSQAAHFGYNWWTGTPPVTPPVTPPSCPVRYGLPSALSMDRLNRSWRLGEPVPTEPCGSGTLFCNKLNVGKYCSEFGSPWPYSFPRVWNNTALIPFDKCSIFCHTPEEVDSNLVRRLLAQFPDQARLLKNLIVASPPREDQVPQVLLTLDPKCSGSGGSRQELSNLHDCHCHLAHVTCGLMVKRDNTSHDVTFTDLDAPLTRVLDSFADYPEEEYDVNNCTHGCYRWSTA
ncbi:hypothetical protein GNI_154410 [Gregarina niphandrodes]|uniref:Uncharacterized protein n=1 Tax=Gregarina niphandrodes TaxID=110365 RepID=A0A023AZ90_GRENI|nr:hypothetical protein GNI_154410 [Gregarina niphandrodes]EZG43999.1 hypothetical protein GNI_154410 [Gregarina niphandrodes]|eukprot:XP_011132852.1 hypothetical protein GNI_154410 [Gregarina niphandrodes]